MLKGIKDVKPNVHLLSFSLKDKSGEAKYYIESKDKRFTLLLSLIPFISLTPNISIQMCQTHS